MKVLELIDYLEQSIEISSKNLVGKVSINKKETLKTLGEIRRLLPDELEEAKNIIKKKDAILSQAKRDAEEYVENARRKAREEYENSDILISAKAAAEDIIENANNEAKKTKVEAAKYAKDVKFGVMNYTDKTLSNLQKEIDLVGEENIKNIQKQMEDMLINIYKQISSTTSMVRENMKDLGEGK